MPVYRGYRIEVEDRVMVATADGNPPDETGLTDTQAVLVFREPNPRELSLERSEAPHRSTAYRSYHSQGPQSGPWLCTVPSATCFVDFGIASAPLSLSLPTMTEASDPRHNVDDFLHRLMLGRHALR